MIMHDPMIRPILMLWPTGDWHEIQWRHRPLSLNQIKAVSVSIRNAYRKFKLFLSIFAFLIR